RKRSKSFFDHFSQATLFFNSQSEAEKNHLVNALRFELGKVERVEIRERMVGLLSQVDKILATRVADGLGMKVPRAPQQPLNHSVPADGDPKKFQPKYVQQAVEKSGALSMANTIKTTIKTRQIAILAADGVDEKGLLQMKNAVVAAGGQVKIIAPKLGDVTGDKGSAIKADQSFLTASSVLFDALYLPGGAKNVSALLKEPDAIHFINEVFKHCKAIAVENEGFELLKSSSAGEKIMQEEKSLAKQGIIISQKAEPGKITKEFIKAIAMHRFWDRENISKVPA
ncbi:MAG: catalase-related domain-containing protein, partial [Chitinophagales bacterium]